MIKNNKDLYKELYFFINTTLLPYVNKVREYNSSFGAMLSVDSLNNHFVIEPEDIGVSIFIIFEDFGLYIYLDDNNKLFNLEFLQGENYNKIFKNKEPLNNFTEVIYNFLKAHNKEYPEEQCKEKIKDF